jgi:hypothetical protein
MRVHADARREPYRWRINSSSRQAREATPHAAATVGSQLFGEYVFRGLEQVNVGWNGRERKFETCLRSCSGASGEYLAVGTQGRLPNKVQVS